MFCVVAALCWYAMHWPANVPLRMVSTQVSSNLLQHIVALGSKQQQSPGSLMHGAAEAGIVSAHAQQQAARDLRILCRVCSVHATPEYLQVIYAGKKAQLAIGNIKPVGELPEGTIICNLEAKQVRLMPVWASGCSPRTESVCSAFDLVHADGVTQHKSRSRAT